MLTRRGMLLGSAGVTGAALTGAVAWLVLPNQVEQILGLAPEPWVPDDPEGVVQVDRVRSAAMGADVDLFTAVPHGFGDGKGLPVVVVLHGASASARDLRAFGLGRFVTAAVRAGTPPFVLAGTDDGPVGWISAGGSDPPAMLREELPGWLEQRGFAAGRRALWGWSRGGYGALAFAAANRDGPGRSRCSARRWARTTPYLPDSALSTGCRWACGAARTTRSLMAPGRWPTPCRGGRRSTCSNRAATRGCSGTTTPWRRSTGSPRTLS